MKQCCTTKALFSKIQYYRNETRLVFHVLRHLDPLVFCTPDGMPQTHGQNFDTSTTGVKGRKP